MIRTIKEYAEYVCACTVCLMAALIMLPVTMYLAYKDEKEIDDDLRKADSVRNGLR